MRAKHLFIPLALGLALIWVLGGRGGTTVAMPRAGEQIEAPSAPDTELHICLSGCAYSSIQDAVDAAADGDIIKVATDTYTGVNNRGGMAQVVYISKTVTVRGGYTVDNWTTPDPQNNPTTLDAQGQGRVLYITGNISPTVEGLRITGGDASYGGGLYLVYSDAALTGNIISSNVAEDGGGGLYLDLSDATISGNTIANNTADVGGGLFLDGGDARVSGNTITNNTASWGGGLYIWYRYGDATLTGNTFANNTANVGGGLYLSYSNARVNGNTIANNFADVGGGLFLDHSTATLSGNIITNNSADEYTGFGGGLLLSGSDATLINNVVTNNRASRYGSGLYIQYSSPRLLHTTIARNTGGDGSGVYISNDWKASTIALTNTILASHSVGISVTEGNTITINGILWHSTPITVSQPVTSLVKVQNQCTGDPAFANPNAGDYHIGHGSAAIDVGVDAGVDRDIDDEPRPLGSGYDFGADEAGLVLTKQAYPDPVQPSAPLTYTIRVTNVTDMDLHATITDTLPLFVTLGETSGGTLALPGGTIVLPDGTTAVTWTAVITAPGGIWMSTVPVTVDEEYVGPLTNQVEVMTDEGIVGTAGVTVSAGSTVYLPVVLRSFP
jgi:hypothetical protein